MCCVVSLLVFFGPRIAAIAWYFMDNVRWDLAFGSILWPILGILLLPWTTMAWVLMSPGIAGLDWIVVGIGFLIDVAANAGGGYSRNRRG